MSLKREWLLGVFCQGLARIFTDEFTTEDTEGTERVFASALRQAQCDVALRKFLPRMVLPQRTQKAQ